MIRQSWHRVLGQTVARNGRIALRRSHDGDEADAPQRLASRMLAVSVDGTMLVERPSRPGAAALCQAGARLDVILPDGQQCWAGRCTVLGAMSYALNRRKRVYAIQVTAAGRVWSAQRRRFFRVNAAGAELSCVYVIPTGPPADTAPLPIGDEDKARGRDGFEAALSDVSGGGMGLRIPARSDLARWLDAGMALRCVFRLPDDDRPVDVPAELMRVQRIEGGLLHLGVAIMLTDPLERRKLEDRLTRYATQLERSQLQRQRGA